MNLEQIPVARWRLPLFGSACSVCGRPADALWVLAEDRVVAHPGGAACRLPNPRSDADPVLRVTSAA